MELLLWGVPVKAIVICVLVATVPLTVLSLTVERMCIGRGIGLRALQFVALGVALPIIAILAVEKILDGAVIGTLLGAVVGYLFALKEQKSDQT